MIWVKNDQKKDYAEIKAILEREGIDFLEMEEMFNRDEIWKEVSTTKSQLEEFDNKDTLKQEVGFLGALLKERGWVPDTFEITIKKKKPSDYGSEYELQINFDPAVVKLLTNEENDEDWEMYEEELEEFVSEFEYLLRVSTMDFSEEKTYSIEIPRQKNEYFL